MSYTTTVVTTVRLASKYIDEDRSEDEESEYEIPIPIVVYHSENMNSSKNRAASVENKTNSITIPIDILDSKNRISKKYHTEFKESEENFVPVKIDIDSSGNKNLDGNNNKKSENKSEAKIMIDSENKLLNKYQKEFKKFENKTDIIPTLIDNNNNNNLENAILNENCNLGAIKLTVFYDVAKNLLSVTIHEARNLKNIYKKSLIQPYVRVFLLPDDKKKSLKRRTKLFKNSLNPKWEETFDYPIKLSTAESKDLIINLKDGRGIFVYLGEICLRLKDLDIKKSYTRWFYLQHNKMHFKKKK